MLKVVNYLPQHLEKISVRACQKSEVPPAILTSALTFLRDETPVAIFGGFMISHRIMNIWGLISDEVKKFPVAFHKTSREVLEFYWCKPGVRRIQADVRVDFLMGQAWAESMGFVREGVMRGFGNDGSDHYLYARVK